VRRSREQTVVTDAVEPGRQKWSRKRRMSSRKSPSSDGRRGPRTHPAQGGYVVQVVALVLARRTGDLSAQHHASRSQHVSLAASDAAHVPEDRETLGDASDILAECRRQLRQSKWVIRHVLERLKLDLRSELLLRGCVWGNEPRLA
jgi:hypothetical protein